MRGAELSRRQKAGVLMMVLAVMIIGGIECGDIGFEAGATLGIICTALAFVLWA